MILKQWQSVLCRCWPRGTRRKKWLAYPAEHKACPLRWKPKPRRQFSSEDLNLFHDNCSSGGPRGNIADLLLRLCLSMVGAERKGFGRTSSICLHLGRMGLCCAGRFPCPGFDREALPVQRQMTLWFGQEAFTSSWWKSWCSIEALFGTAKENGALEGKEVLGL